MNLNTKLKAAMAIGALIVGAQAMAQVTFYENEGYRGRAFAADRPINDFGRFGFNDRASSVVVDRGRWEVCEDNDFRGRCVVLRRGNYDSLRALGFDNRISSVRPVAMNSRVPNEIPAPVAAPVYEYRQRPNERLIEVPVTSARAVVGPPNQRCWVERQQVTEPARGPANVGGAIVGGLLGGILGHQVGGGTGRDVATAGGAVAGAALGANVNRNNVGGNVVDRDVQRCENVANPTPAYWDVTYNYRGMEHRVQMAAAPGPTISVNAANGEPRS